MNKFLKVITLIVTVSLLSGCGIQIFAPRDTIKAPGATGFYAGVQDALEQSVGSDINLKYPLVDGVRTAFCTKDLDNCGGIEILAFYKKKTDSVGTHINVLCQDDGKWKSVQDIDLMGNELLQISFADLDADGCEEVVAGWQVHTKKDNQLCVYKMENKALVQRAGETYSAFTVCDIDNNGKQEIAVSLLNTETKKASATFYEFKDNEFILQSHLVLDGNISSYAGMSSSKLKTGETAIYLDAYKSSDTMITELIYMKDGVLYNPFADPNTRENRKTLRRVALKSRDINGDGFIEIPFMYSMNGYENGDPSEKQYITFWKYFDTEEYDTVLTAWYCKAQGYYLVLDNELAKKITVIYDSNEGTAIFCKWDKAGEAAGDEIFRIAAVDSNVFKKSPPEGYTKISETTEKVFAVKMGEASDFDLDPKKISQSFKYIID